MASQISPLEKVHTGLWIDHAIGPVSGLTLTVTNSQGFYLIATLAIFVRLAAGHFWDLLCWIWFHVHKSDQQRDGLYYQHQALLRNNLTDIRACWQFSLTAWAWKNRAQRPILRSLPIIIAALVHFIAFAAAGIFSSRVTDSRSNVLISGPTCGWFYAPTTFDQAGMIQQASQDDWTLTAYKRSLTQSASCHAFNTTTVQQSLQDCKAWGRRFVPYSMKTNVPCPFAKEMCIDDLAVEFETDVIDSTLDLGINAPVKDRVHMQHRIQCAPITTKGYKHEISHWNVTDIPSTFTNNGYPDWGGYLGYSYGNSVNPTSEYTYVWTNYTFGNTLGATTQPPSYQISLGAYQTTLLGTVMNTFEPIPQLNVTDSDVLMFFITNRNLTFLEPSNDPVFGATVRSETVMGDDYGVNHVLSLYSPEEPVGIIGCSQQWQFCNPNLNTCTPWSRKTEANTHDLNFTQSQKATGERMAGATSLPELGVLVTVLGNEALLASSATGYGIGGAHLPDDQWIREVDNWLSIYWNAVQLFIAQYPVGSGVQSEDKYVQPPKPEDEWMCHAQVVQRNDYSSFNMLGVLLILCSGVFFMIVNLTIDPVSEVIQQLYARSQNRNHQRVSLWRRNYVLQLLSVAFESAGKGEWDHERMVPTTAQDEKFYFPLGRDKDYVTVEQEHFDASKDGQTADPYVSRSVSRFYDSH